MLFERTQAIPFVLNGIDTADRAGFTVSGAGDVNADGLADLIVGAYGANPGGRSYAGESYVIYSRIDPPASSGPYTLRTLAGDGPGGESPANPACSNQANAQRLSASKSPSCSARTSSSIWVMSESAALTESGLPSASKILVNLE